MELLARLLLNGIIGYCLQYFISGIHFKTVISAVIFVSILGFLNVFLKPIISIISIPINIITLGLFSFVINTCIVLITNNVLGGHIIDGFGSAFLFSILYSFLVRIVSR